jgi:hypothetical protein
MDSQVKLRGYRIELGEIEAQLGRHPAVAACAVIVREDVPGDQRLVAYWVARGSAPRPEQLRAQLAQFLPEFMVPSSYVALDALPLTPNGKIDRRALPAPGASAPRAAERREPQSELEREIAEVWKQVLQLEAVGRTEGFFELGGHSLLVVQAHRLLRERIEHPLTLTDLYRFPTVAALAEHLAGRGSRGDAPAPDRSVQGGEERGDRRRRALAQRGRRRGEE